VKVIKVRVLGPLEVTVQGAPADVGGPRQRCVLARLIAARGEVVSADRLIDDLYPGEAPPKALAGVQSYVSHLRRALEPGRPARSPAGVLVTSPPGYAMRLDGDAVDAWVFEDEVHQTAGLDDSAAVHARLTAALACWRGAAFEEFGGLPWADLETARLDELRLVATERLADAALRLGRAAEVVADLSRLTARHPLREEAWRLLALAQYQSGRQGDALATLRRARVRLADELGVDPGPALRELEDAILAQAPHLSRPVASPSRPAAPARPAGTARPAGGVTVPTDAPAFFGRDAELARLMQAARETAAGQLRIALVAGEAGAGKTALASQLGRRLAADGWMITTGRCPEHDGAPPGWAWAQALRSLARNCPPGAPEPLAALLTDTMQHDEDASTARFRLHEAVARYLEEVSGAVPLLVVLDDLHRADGETLAVLTSLAADLTTASVMILATHRPDEPNEQLPECLATLATREPLRIALDGLDAVAAGQLVAATCTTAVDEATVQAITQRTGGNPFFLRETARLLDSEGVPTAVGSVPAGVRDVLQRRIARLPATAQTILGQAAVIGTETDVDVLGAVAAADDHVLLDAVEAGLLSGLITEPAVGQIRFAHALIRDTFYDSLSRLRRSRLHARAATAIERHRPGDVTALAYHFSQARTDPSTAARYCGLAAQQAEQRFAYREAARLWEQAIACLDQAGDPPVRDRLELMLALVRALNESGQHGRARLLREAAVRAALPLDDPALLARVITSFEAMRMWQNSDYGAVDDEIVDAIEQTLARLPPEHQLLRCRLLAALAFELDGAESERGYVASAEALQLARTLGDSSLLAIAIFGRCVQSFRHDGLAERMHMGAELLATPGKSVIIQSWARELMIKVSCGVGDFDVADVHAREAARLAERYNIASAAFNVTFFRALRAALAGDVPGASQLYRQGAAEMERLGLGDPGFAVSVVGRFCLLLMHDRVAEMAGELEHLAAAISAASGVPELYALALAANGRRSEARAVAGDPRPIRPDQYWLLLTGVRGLLGIALDDKDRAGSAYRALLPFAGRPVGAETGLFTLWPAAQILGDLAGYLGLPGAEAHYEHALAIAEKANVEPWRAAARRLS
jgi:DNA-binding SARP family transcriptional activator/tetratricopeptide (TPR) repeat protein